MGHHLGPCLGQVCLKRPDGKRSKTELAYGDAGVAQGNSAS